jgi:pathogenesis-related protein 1
MNVTCIYNRYKDMKITGLSLAVASVVVFLACSAEDFGPNREQQSAPDSTSPGVIVPAGGGGGDSFRSNTSATGGANGGDVAGGGGNSGTIDTSGSGDSGDIYIIDGGGDGSGQQVSIDSGSQEVGDTGQPDASASNPETDRLAGITAAHNVVRAAVATNDPLPPLTWSDTMSAYAQEWADTLALTCVPEHRSSSELARVRYGENLAAFGSSWGGSASTAQQAVDGWASEANCWTYGQFMTTDNCDATCYVALHSDGCGHYTQIVWRNTTELGCAVSTCTSGGLNYDIWVCNYNPAGNVVMGYPY